MISIVTAVILASLHPVRTIKRTQWREYPGPYETGNPGIMILLSEFYDRREDNKTGKERSWNEHFRKDKAGWSKHV